MSAAPSAGSPGPSGATTCAAGAGSTPLPAASSVLAVCAHPDDESFGLGALLDAYARAGATTAVLCFTRGEASTLGRLDPAALRAAREAELAGAAEELGVSTVVLRDHPDGTLAEVALDALADDVAVVSNLVAADLLLVFDEGGITGHPDHEQATRAALAAAGRTGTPVLAWAVAEEVAAALRRELGTPFVGRPPAAVDAVVVVDRAAQLRAIAHHASQSADNPVLRRRLALQGDRESVRWLRRRQGGTGMPPTGAVVGP